MKAKNKRKKWRMMKRRRKKTNYFVDLCVKKSFYFVQFSEKNTSRSRKTNEFTYRNYFEYINFTRPSERITMGHVIIGTGNVHRKT